MQNVAIRTSGAAWAFLEPAMVPDYAREDHVIIAPAAAGTYVLYPLGQIIRQKTDGTNNWAKIGTAGYAGPPRIIKHSILVNDQGQHQMTDNATWSAGRDTLSGSVSAYYQGFFKTQELVGAGGTNEVQTETLDAGVDGGTRTLKFGPYVTAPIAWNAAAAAIKTAILAAVPTLTTADLTVAGAASPFTYTFGGAFAGANMPLIVVDPTMLTDGGVAPATTGSVFAETTPGASLITGVGRLVRGTNVTGILQLGVGAPA